MLTNSPSNWTLRDFFRVLFRHRRRATTFFAGTIVLAGLALVVWPRTYESEAKLFVRLGRENASLDPTATTGQVISLNSSRETEINSVVEMLGSRSIVEKVVDSLHEDTESISNWQRDKLIRGLINHINIESPKMSTVVKVSCKASTPERAQETVATLLDVYMAEHLRVNRTPGSYDFFEEQSKVLSAELDRANAELRDVKTEYGIASLEGRRLALQAQISENEKRISETEAALRAAEAKVDSLRRGLETVPAPLVRQIMGGAPNDAVADMRQQLYQLQAREQELLARCTEKHPAVIVVRRQVEGLEKILDLEKPSHGEAVAAVVAIEESNVDSLMAQRKVLADQRAAIQQDLREFTEEEALIKHFERKVTQLELQHLSYVEKFEQARVDQALKAERISNINIIQPASFELQPVAPHTAVLLMLAFVIATFGAVGIALVSEYLDQSLQTSEDVEARLDLPMLASIPHTTRWNLFLSTNN